MFRVSSCDGKSFSSAAKEISEFVKSFWIRIYNEVLLKCFMWGPDAICTVVQLTGYKEFPCSGVKQDLESH